MFLNTSSVLGEAPPRQVPKMWTSENTLKLIEDLHSLPCLWDVRSAEYKDRIKKDDAYVTLANKYSVSVMQAEKKIQALKTQFRREHRKCVVSKRSGGCLKKAAWFGYEPLLFLVQGCESRDNRSTDEKEVQNEVGFKHLITFTFTVLIKFYTLHIVMNLMVEAVRISETSVYFKDTTRHYISRRLLSSYKPP